MADMGDIDSSEWGAVEDEGFEGDGTRKSVKGLQRILPKPQLFMNGLPTGRQPLKADAEGEEEGGSVIQLSSGFVDPLNVMSDGASVKRSSTLFESMLAGDPDSLLSLETRFQSLVIDELELVKSSKSDLTSAIHDLEALRLDVLRYAEKDEVRLSEALKRKIEEILTAIAREVSLYEQFSNADYSRLLDLDTILRSGDQLVPDEDAFSSPRSPPTVINGRRAMFDVSRKHPPTIRQ
ncbi:hypothetical protein HDU67_002383 [Dinochytrium kinnereticum]|nr:hypothetical protein HDU67_002383 [Dinochytrium kinnereticum]